MSKVLCPSNDCVHYKNGSCSLKEVRFREWYINTVNEGRKHMWECLQYEMSAEIREMFGEITRHLEKIAK